MPADSGIWTWSQSRQSGTVVAVVLTRPNQTIALAFRQPEGWTGERELDRNLVRTILHSAVEDRWSPGPFAT